MLENWLPRIVRNNNSIAKTMKERYKDYRESYENKNQEEKGLKILIK